MPLFALDNPLQAFEPLFAQRALLALAALAILSAVVGPAIVLRELPFFSHAVGSGAYPALVLAAGVGIPVALMAPVGALVFAGVLWAVSVSGERTGRNRDAETALLVASSFAIGAVLATTAFTGQFQIGLSPESLLFGSVLTASTGTIVTAYGACLLCGAAVWLLGQRWLALGFDPVAPRPHGWRLHEAALLGTIALAVAATLPLAGALMGAALLVVPTATARVLTSSRERLAQLTLLLASTEGVIGLYLALEFDLPPGAVIATLAGVVFALAAIAQSLRAGTRRTRRPAVAVALIATMAVAVAGCGGSDGGSGDDANPKVVATTTQVGDIARQVGGDDVAVTVLLEPGTDPHNYEPTPSDVQALADAGVILYNGGDIDAWLADAVKASGSKKTPVDVSQSVTLLEGDGAHTFEDGEHAASGHGDENFNPHWYLDPANLSAAAARIRTELIKANPDARETYRANTDRYIQLVETVTADLNTCAKTIPAANRSVVTEHDDFAYLLDFLGVEVAAQLRDTGTSEASARDADDALDKARKAGAGAVIVSEGEGGKLAATAAERLDVPLLELHGDSLARSGMARTALGAIVDDTRQIVDALGGDVERCPRVGS